MPNLDLVARSPVELDADALGLGFNDHGPDGLAPFPHELAVESHLARALSALGRN